jgi:hypothetical protein
MVVVCIVDVFSCCCCCCLLYVMSVAALLLLCVFQKKKIEEWNGMAIRIFLDTVALSLFILLMHCSAPTVYRSAFFYIRCTFESMNRNELHIRVCASFQMARKYARHLTRDSRVYHTAIRMRIRRMSCVFQAVHSRQSTSRMSSPNLLRIASLVYAGP